MKAKLGLLLMWPVPIVLDFWRSGCAMGSSTGVRRRLQGVPLCTRRHFHPSLHNNCAPLYAGFKWGTWFRLS